MRLLIDLVLPLLLLLAIVVVGLGAVAVLRMPHRPDAITTATPDGDRDRQPVA
ncbi:hypothetical protein [Kitasatospora brasiliensis]|uniref:hypothetical protein n=1 Tax=Kitasatospora brasiliensis TaxID=3058040 RepID=UPI00292FACD9|nr:hypothetical protein [Kitasatospora sp. K002]